MNSNELPHHSKPSHNMLDKLSNKISAIKDDITAAVKDRRRSISSDRTCSISSTNSLASLSSIPLSSQDDNTSIKMRRRQLSKTSGKY